MPDVSKDKSGKLALEWQKLMLKIRITNEKIFLNLQFFHENLVKEISVIEIVTSSTPLGCNLSLERLSFALIARLLSFSQVDVLDMSANSNDVLGDMIRKLFKALPPNQ